MSALEGSWGVLGRLGASWAVLRPSCERHEAILRASWGVLGGVLERFERVMERLGLIFERLRASWRRLERLGSVMGPSWERFGAA